MPETRRCGVVPRRRACLFGRYAPFEAGPASPPCDWLAGLSGGGSKVPKCV